MDLVALSRWNEGRMQLAARVGETLVALVELYNYDPVHRRAEVGIVVDTPYRFQGYGADALRELERYVQQHLALHLLYCDILEDNLVSQHLFAKCGYVQCGRFTEWVSDEEGNYHDVVRYQKLL